MGDRWSPRLVALWFWFGGLGFGAAVTFPSRVIQPSCFPRWDGPQRIRFRSGEPGSVGRWFMLLRTYIVMLSFAQVSFQILKKQCMVEMQTPSCDCVNVLATD